MDDRTKYTVALKVIDLKVIQTEENHRKRDIMLRLSETEDKMMILCDSPNLIRCFDVYEN